MARCFWRILSTASRRERLFAGMDFDTFKRMLLLKKVLLEHFSTMLLVRDGLRLKGLRLRKQ